MARRRRGRKNNNNLTMVLIAIICIAGLAWLFSKIDLSGESPCGKREEDTTRPGYCLPKANDYDELVIVSGNTQNSPSPNLDFSKNDELKDILSGVFYSTERGSYPKITIVSASSSNNVIDFVVKNKPANNASASNNELKHLANDINKAITASPTTGGANYLGGILYAKELISSSSSNPLILVVGSGYSDSGILDFANNDLFGTLNYYGEEGIYNILSQSRIIEKDMLKGKTVQWYNLGEVVAPQSSLKDYKTQLRKIYTTAFSYLGVKKQDIDKNLGISGNAKSVDSNYTVQQVYVDELKVGDTFSVNENIGEFYGDKDVLKNPDDIRRSLRQFASRFNANGNTKLKLTGYIAFCVSGSMLGYYRANTIKNILVELGIPAEKIETYGQPGMLPTNKNEEYSCNNGLPETENRTVMIEVIEG